MNRALGTLGIVIGVTAAVLISPIALVFIDALWRNDWHHLADIGQTYGVVSAIFSALAVVGVAASLIYQARSHRLVQVQTVRGTQRELLSRVMDNPKIYGPALGFEPLKQDGTLLEQRLMVTAWVGYLYSAYDSGAVAEEDLRNDALAALFSGTIGRKWWERGSRAWTESKDPKERKFARILDDIYTKSAITNLAIRETPTFPRREKTSDSSLAYIMLAAAVGAVVGGYVVRRKR